MGKYQKSTRRRFFIITDMVVCRKLARSLSARAPIYAPWQQLISEAVTSWLTLYTSTTFYMLYIFRKVYHLGQDFILVLGSPRSGAGYMPQLNIWLWLLIITQIKTRSKKSNNCFLEERFSYFYTMEINAQTTSSELKALIRDNMFSELKTIQLIALSTACACEFSWMLFAGNGFVGDLFLQRLHCFIFHTKASQGLMRKAALEIWGVTLLSHKHTVFCNACIKFGITIVLYKCGWAWTAKIFIKTA